MWSTLPTDSEGKREIQGWEGSLYGWARIYARRERASEALDIANDTSDLDAQLIEMGAWEWHTAHLVGVFTPPHLLWEENRRIRDKEAAFERELEQYHTTMIGGLPHEHMESEILGGFHAWWGDWPTLEESKVYAYWLRYLSRGPKWDDIPTASPEQIADLLHRTARSAIPDTLRFEHQKQIAVRLREEVRAVSAATQQYREAQKRGRYTTGAGRRKIGET